MLDKPTNPLVIFVNAFSLFKLMNGDNGKSNMQGPIWQCFKTDCEAILMKTIKPIHQYKGFDGIEWKLQNIVQRWYLQADLLQIKAEQYRVMKPKIQLRSLCLLSLIAVILS